MCCGCGTQSSALTLSSVRSAVSLLISCLDDLSFGESEVLKSPTLTVLLSFLPVVLLIFALYILVSWRWVHID